jgi:hypothetical protein
MSTGGDRGATLVYSIAYFQYQPDTRVKCQSGVAMNPARIGPTGSFSPQFMR